MDQPVVISSLVVNVDPAKTQEVIDAINAVEGAEVAEHSEDKLVVVIEKPSLDESHDCAFEMGKIDGVITVSLVYCNFEELVDNNIEL